MPDPFNRTKMSGDTHPPELESDLPPEEGGANAARAGSTSTDRGTAAERGGEARPNRTGSEAGLDKKRRRDSER